MERRRFLKIATCGVGGVVGVGVLAPVGKLVLAPAGMDTVRAASGPIDIGDASRIGAEPKRLDVIAPVVQDAWSAAQDVLLGAAYVRKNGDKLEAFSSVCPHLGCAIGWDGKSYLCPCHDSRFDVAGAHMTGPAERGLDPLPLEVKDGRLLLTWVRYKMGGSGREQG